MSEVGEKAQRAPMSIQQQAEFVEALAKRCHMVDGSVARESLLSLTADEAEDLAALAKRLYRIAPHETEIRRMVTGR